MNKATRKVLFKHFVFQTSAPRLPEPVVADSKISNYINNNNNSQQVPIICLCSSLKLSTQGWASGGQQARRASCAKQELGEHSGDRVGVEARRQEDGDPGIDQRAPQMPRQLPLQALLQVTTHLSSSKFPHVMKTQAARFPTRGLHHVASHRGSVAFASGLAGRLHIISVQSIHF